MLREYVHVCTQGKLYSVYFNLPKESVEVLLVGVEYFLDNY